MQSVIRGCLISSAIQMFTWAANAAFCKACFSFSFAFESFSASFFRFFSSACLALACCISGLLLFVYNGKRRTKHVGDLSNVNDLIPVFASVVGEKSLLM